MMKSNQIAIISETPFQLIAGLNLAYHLFPENRYVIFPIRKMFMSNREFTIINNKDDDGRIYNVHYLNRFSIRDYITPTGILLLYLRFSMRHKLPFPSVMKRYLLRRYFPDILPDEKYDAVIVHKYGDTVLFNLIYDQIANYSKIYLIEEGIGEYYIFDNQGKHEPYYAFQKNVMGRYLLSPELYKHQSEYDIIKAPSLSEDTDFIKLINSVFGSVENINARCIYFAQPYDSDFGVGSMELKEGKVMDILSGCIPHQDIVCKLHPRQERGSFYNLKTIDTLASWEQYLLSSENIDDKILVSISSTALLTPKLLQNKEPYVICLIQLFEEELCKIITKENYNSLLNIMFTIKEMYEDSNAFLIPSSFEELEEGVMYLSSLEYLNRE